MRYILLTLLIFFMPYNRATAQDSGKTIYSQSITTHNNKTWLVSIEDTASGDVLRVTDQATDKRVYEYLLEDPIASLVDVLIIENSFEISAYTNVGPIITAIWTNGAHGEFIVAIRPIKNEILLEEYSSWPITHSLCGNWLSLTLAGDMQADGTPETKDYIVAGDDLPTDPTCL